MSPPAIIRRVCVIPSACNADTWSLEGQAFGCPSQSRNVGYFNLGFERPAGALKMQDLREFSIAGLKYYAKSGRLIDDLTQDFMETAESTIAPTPVVIDQVGSPAALAAAAANHSNTFVIAPSLDEVMCSVSRHDIAAIWVAFF